MALVAHNGGSLCGMTDKGTSEHDEGDFPVHLLAEPKASGHLVMYRTGTPLTVERRQTMVQWAMMMVMGPALLLWVGVSSALAVFVSEPPNLPLAATFIGMPVMFGILHVTVEYVTRHETTNDPDARLATGRVRWPGTPVAECLGTVRSAPELTTTENNLFRFVGSFDTHEAHHPDTNEILPSLREADRLNQAMSRLPHTPPESTGDTPNPGLTRLNGS